MWLRLWHAGRATGLMTDMWPLEFVRFIEHIVYAPCQVLWFVVHLTITLYAEVVLKHVYILVTNRNIKQHTLTHTHTHTHTHTS
jgi:hypothetical protein